MGTLGTNIQTTVNNLIDNDNFKSSATIKSRTVTGGSYGGYEAGSASSSSTAVNCIPFSYIQDDVDPQRFGDVSEGEVRIIFKGGTTIDIDDHVTYLSKDWFVRSIEPLVFNDVEVGIVTLLSPVSPTSI